jgi:hypothetical protein
VYYVGVFTNPETQQPYFVYATRDRQPFFIPQHPQYIPMIGNDDYPDDAMGSPRPRSPRPRSPRPRSPRPRSPRPRSPRPRSAHQQAARQRIIQGRLDRRAAMQQFHDNQIQNMFANPANIFNPQPQLPPPMMERPASPVRNPPPNPNSRRSRRRQRVQERQQRQPSNVISQRPQDHRVVGGKTRRRRLN